ncbi:helix-turn-helix transcriptional regulator [Streptomyces sp. SID3343]|uniref:helix-turn-helix domain-containing protein n=1 Tax=Streptomyces sp. SID3343 TaxID=2690260 RepID=UPI00136ADC0C|nr:helix-turn-helix transcriptional regulator [Streptomyces sp. SID3343]MYW02917.1 helix-turn-helix domain-containing protein [Streptomyces sp. SID3343]
MSVGIGERLRDVRKRRGMSQRELADQSGVSLSLIRKLEQGERDDTRLETARQLASALRVPTTSLMVDSNEESAPRATLDQWEPVRRALIAPRSSADDLEEPTLHGVRTALRAAMPLFSGDRFAELGAVLPSLLRDAEVLAQADPDGRAVQARLMRLTGSLLTQTRQFDAADMALERALDGAADRLEGAAVVNTQCWLLLRRGKLAEARELATTWADATEPRLSRATPAELSAWGWLLLRVSAAGVRDNRPGDAEDALRLSGAAAAALAREYAPREDLLRAFGPITVALKRIENAAIVNKPGRVLQLAARIPVDKLKPTSNNRNRHLLDVADAYARTRQFAEAVDVLHKIRAGSPEWLPNQRYAQDIMGRLVAGRRTLTPEMRTLFGAVGLSHSTAPRGTFGRGGGPTKEAAGPRTPMETD